MTINDYGRSLELSHRVGGRRIDAWGVSPAVWQSRRSTSRL